MPAPHNIALPCVVSRADALIAFRGFFNPRAVHLRFVTNGQVIDYVDDLVCPGGYRPSRSVDVRMVAAFLLDPTPTETAIPLDRDLSGQWQGERVKLVYYVNGPHDPAIVFLSREDAARLAGWMRETAGLAESAP